MLQAVLCAHLLARTTLVEGPHNTLMFSILSIPARSVLGDKVTNGCVSGAANSTDIYSASDDTNGPLFTRFHKHLRALSSYPIFCTCRHYTAHRPEFCNEDRRLYTTDTLGEDQLSALTTDTSNCYIFSYRHDWVMYSVTVRLDVGNSLPHEWEVSFHLIFLTLDW